MIEKIIDWVKQNSKKIVLKKVFEGYKITQKYGMTPFAIKMKKRYLETGKKLYKYFIHTGLDFSMCEGTEVKSPISGIVAMDADANKTGKGIAVSIWDKKQSIGCRFYHLSINFVTLKQKIKAGHVIGLSGKTAGSLTIGNVPHLHFEVVRTDQEGKAVGEYGGSIDPLNSDIVRWVKK